MTRTYTKHPVWTWKCDECGRFIKEPAEVIPVKDSVHPYTADYWNVCAHCVAERGGAE